MFDRVAELAQTIEIEHKLTLEELLNVIINRDDIEKLLKQPVIFILKFFWSSLTKEFEYILNFYKVF